MTPDAETALELAIRIAGVGALISSLELLHERTDFTDGRLLGFRPICLTTTLFSRGVTGRAFGLLFATRAFTGVIAARGAAATALVLAPAPESIAPVSVPVIFVTTLLFHARNPYGTRGADQMLLVIFGALFVRELAGGGLGVTEASAGFIAAQACLAYTTAGLAKLSSGEWRSGTAVGGVLRTQTYGSAKLARFFYAHPALATSLAWLVIGFECLFAVGVFLGGIWLVAALALGVGFHLIAAIVMHLNDFLWAFLATYPCLAFAAGAI